MARLVLIACLHAITGEAWASTRSPMGANNEWLSWLGKGCTLMGDESAAIQGEVGDQSAATLASDSPPSVKYFERIVVTATGRPESVDTIPSGVAIIEGEYIRTQMADSSNLRDVLGEVVPGLGPGTESLSLFGQALRGRDVLVLIDNIPQSTIRNVGADLSSLGTSGIERVEIKRGATAIFGDGATGGIINIITRDGGATRKYSTFLGLGTSVGASGAPGIGSVQQTLSRPVGPVNITGSVEYSWIGGRFDAHGERIPPDPHGQGGVADTRSWNVFGKASYQIDYRRRIETLSTSFRSDQESDYASDLAVSQSIPGAQRSRAVKGLKLESDPGTRNDNFSLGYEDSDVFGGTLYSQLYYRDYAVRFFPFDGRRFDIFGNSVFQPSLTSKKLGGRFEFERLVPSFANLQLTLGVEAGQEETAQPVELMDTSLFERSSGLEYRSIGRRTWVPPIKLARAAVFAQGEWHAMSRLVVHAGLRHTDVVGAVEDYSTITDNYVRGGRLPYSGTVFNIGATFGISSIFSTFANISEGFAIPDLGRTLRGAPGGASVYDLELRAQKVTNYEGGVRAQGRRYTFEGLVFYSTSDLGASVGDFESPVIRAPERLYGFELDFRFLPSERRILGGNYSWLEGKHDIDGDGKYKFLDSFRIQPPKLMAFWEEKGRKVDSRLQILLVGDRKRFGSSTAFGERSVKSYCLVDWYGQARVGSHSVIFGIDNVFNTFYFPVKSQLLWSGRNDSYTAGMGATFRLGISVRRK